MADWFDDNAPPTTEQDWFAKNAPATAAVAAEQPPGPPPGYVGRGEFAFDANSGPKVTPEQSAESAKHFDDPFVSPELMRKALTFTSAGTSEAIPGLMDTLFPNNPVSEVIRGGELGLSDIASSLTTPTNIALLGVGGPALKPLGKLGTVLLSSAFEAQALRHAPEQWQQFKNAYAAGDYEKATQIGIGMVAGLGLPAAAVALHGAAPPKTTLAETLFPTEKPPVAEVPSAIPEGYRQVAPNVFEKTPPQEISPVAGEPIQQAPMAEVIAPEPVSPVAAEGQPDAVPAEAAQVIPEPTGGTTAAISEIERRNAPEPTKLEEDVAAHAAVNQPKLLPGETQGDLISSTQPEDLKLVGEKGTDTKAAIDAAAQRAEEARLKAEHEQGLLSDFQEHQARGGDELLDAVNSGGGLPAKSSPRADVLSGELKNIREEVVSETGKQKYGFDYNKVFKGDAPDLDTLTQHLRAKGFDVETPNDTLSLIQERLRGGKPVYGSEARGANDWTGATEPAIGGGMKLGSGERGALNLGPLKDIQDSALLKRRMSPLDAATGERSARLQKSFADAERAQKEIKRVAPTERRQGAISVWMEANGDAAKLDQWSQSAKGKVFRQAAEDAKTMAPEEIAIAQKAQSALAILSRRGQAYDVLSNHRDNYVPHVWNVTKDFTGIGASKLQDKFKFNKARTFENFFDGDQAGFIPKTLAIGKLLPAYLHEMNKVIADRQFVQDVAHMKAKDDRPLVVPRGNAKTVDTTDFVIRDDQGNPLPKGKRSVYETEAEAKAALQPGQTIEKRPSSSALVNPRGFAKAEDAKGNPIEQGDYVALGKQPALANWRWVETDPKGNSTVLKSDLAVHPELAKRINAMMGKSAIREWYNEPSKGISVIPKAIAKGLDTVQAVMKREMFGLLAPFHQVQEGTHGIGHLVNPFFDIPDMSRPTPEHMDAMKHGLMLLPDRASSQNYLEGVGGKNTFITQLARKFVDSKAGDNAAGKVAGAAADVIDGYQNYLFHQYIPGLKFKTYEHIHTRNMERYSGDLSRGELTESDVKLLSAEQTNAAYGHLNYALLDRNPTMQHILQLGLLAPDFLEARARFTGQALKTLAGSKSGIEQFRAIATLAAIQAGIAYTTSKLMGDEWDPKHPFEVTHNGRTYAMRSVPEDLDRLLFQGSDQRREFVSARINPLLQKADQLRTGLNYRGEKTGAIDTMEELLANYIPITARSIPGIRMLTETSRNSPVSPLEQLAGSLGLKISRHSPITKVHQLAAEWMDSQKIERPTGVYPTSKFQQLRYALEDGDMARATGEWKKLVGDGDERKLRDGFKQSINHPFTGNKARDREFADSLKEKDRIIYDHALEVRQGILDKFDSL